MVAGPSEVLVIGDTFSNPKYIAADLIAQAEHDVESSAICLTCSVSLASAVAEEVKIQSSSLTRSKIINESLKRNGRIYVLKTLKDCIRFSNVFAPEHLQIFVRRPADVEKRF